jgi:hypothetical protein
MRIFALCRIGCTFAVPLRCYHEADDYIKSAGLRYNKKVRRPTYILYHIPIIAYGEYEALFGRGLAWVRGELLTFTDGKSAVVDLGYTQNDYEWL